jgi:cell division inhibitor SepF
MSNALRKMTNYLGLTEDDGTSEVVTPKNRVTPVKRENKSLTVAPSMTSAAKSVDAAPIDRIVTITPRFYSEARAIGEYYREGNPVIMNLSDMEESERKRLIDFASGLVFGHAGTIERVTSKVN